MPVQRERWLLNVLLMLSPLLGTEATSTVCPSFCKCTIRENQKLLAECHGTSSRFVTAAQQLPEDLQEYIFTAKHNGSQKGHREVFDTNLPQMLRFQNLTSFKIQPSSQKQYFDFGLNDIPENWVFCRLPNLKSLHLNILLYNFHNASVICLRSLETFDLSHTQRLSGDLIKNVILSLTSGTLKSLLLKNVQTYESSALRRFVFFELLPPTAPFAGALEELDFSYNYISGLGPGASLLPSLRRVDFSGNLIIGNYGKDLFSKLTYVELFVLNPSMEEVRLSFQGFFDPGRLKRSVTEPDAMYTHYEEVVLECLEKSSHSVVTNLYDLCKVQYCLVGSNSLNLSTICEHLPHQHPLEGDSGCSFPRYIPLAPRLRRVSLGSIVSTIGVSPGMKEGTYCFDPNNQLEVLDLSNNRLDDYMKPSDVLNHVKVTGFSKLREFNVEDNNVLFSNPHFLEGSLMLERLRFAGNQMVFGSSNESLFGSLPNLRLLDLSRNGLSDIPDQEFASLHFLETLDLSGNQLSMLNFELSNSTSMQALNLSNNLISSIPPSFSQMLLFSSPNVSVDIRGNPLICGCETMDFIDIVRSGILELYKKEDLFCYNPKQGRVSIVKFDLRTLKKSCSPLLLILQYVGITLAMVLMAALLLILWRMRWKIRLLLYRWRRAANGYQNLVDDFEFDGFVAYSNKDRNWVHYRLQEEIEENRNHRLFMYLRQVLPNENLVQNLRQNMGKSRKVIVVLSKSFLESNHCLYDASLAETFLQHEGRDVVILVKLGRLPFTGVPPMITHLLKTRTCLDWTEDKDGQQLFWNRLEDKLMTPPRNTLRE